MKMDSLHHTPIRRKDNLKLLKLPSEYLGATNVWMENSFQSCQEAVAAIAFGKEDRLWAGSGTTPTPKGRSSSPRTRTSTRGPGSFWPTPTTTCPSTRSACSWAVQRPQRLSPVDDAGTQQGRPADRRHGEINLRRSQLEQVPIRSTQEPWPFVPKVLELNHQGGIADGSQPGRGGGVLSMCGQVPPPPSGGSI